MFSNKSRQKLQGSKVYKKNVGKYLANEKQKTTLPFFDPFLITFVLKPFRADAVFGGF